MSECTDLVKNRFAGEFWIILQTHPSNDRLQCGHLDDISFDAISIDFLNAIATLTAAAPRNHPLMDEDSLKDLVRCWLSMSYHNEPFIEGIIADYSILRWSNEGNCAVNIIIDLSKSKRVWHDE